MSPQQLRLVGGSQEQPIKWWNAAETAYLMTASHMAAWREQAEIALASFNDGRGRLKLVEKKAPSQEAIVKKQNRQNAQLRKRRALARKETATKETKGARKKNVNNSSLPSQAEGPERSESKGDKTSKAERPRRQWTALDLVYSKQSLRREAFDDDEKLCWQLMLSNTECSAWAHLVKTTMQRGWISNEYTNSILQAPTQEKRTASRLRTTPSNDEWYKSYIGAMTPVLRVARKQEKSQSRSKQKGRTPVTRSKGKR